jgi:serine-type D-Ala-D-Ala carboxypeptidase
MRYPDPAIDAVLQEHVVGANVAPGATACVARFSPRGWIYRVGAAGVRSRSLAERVTWRSLFDLASVTKPLVAVTLARLHDRGVLSLDERLATYVPWLAGTEGGRATLDALLSHRSGLAAHVELFAPLRAGHRFAPKDALLHAAGALREECRDAPMGVHSPVYSDLGYLLLGSAVESVTERSLEDVVADELTALRLAGLGSAGNLSRRSADFDERVVPTEVVPYRGGEVRGAVHDDNAWALSGLGLSGHAGLFGTAFDVARFGAWMLDLVAGRRTGLTVASIERLLRRRPGGTLRAGFDGKSQEGSSAGSRLGPETFGHLGFTGTSVWCDPQRQVAVSLLTNRVNPTRANPSISRARPLVHDALLDQTTGEAS